MFPLDSWKDLLRYTRPLHRYCPEHVESWQSGGDHHAGDLRVPVDLLDLGLTLVQEQELRRQVLHSFHPGPRVTWLYGQVPLADHVVRSGGGEHAGVCGAPLHRGDGGAVLLEVSYGTPTLQVKAGIRCDNTKSLSLMTCFSPTGSLGAVETIFYLPVYLYFILFLSLWSILWSLSVKRAL